MLPKGRTSEEGGCEIRGQEKGVGTKQMYRQNRQSGEMQTSSCTETDTAEF